MNRRTLILAGSATLLAGCASSIVEPEVAQSMWVREIRVDASQFEGIKGRNLQKSSAEVQRDVEEALRRRVLGRGVPNGVPVRLDVNIKSVRLVSPGQSLFIGGNSTVASDVTVWNANDGSSMADSVNAVGVGQGLVGGVFGAATRGNPEDDYRNVVDNYAAEIAKRLLGDSSGTRAGAGQIPSSTLPPNAAAPRTGNNVNRPSIWAL